MTKYDERFKLAVVRQYLSGKYGRGEVGRQFGISESMVREWVAIYRHQGSKGLIKKFTHYSANFKHMVLTTMEREHLSQRDAAGKFNIRHPGILAEWKRRYDFGGIDALASRKRGRPKTMPDKPRKSLLPLSSESLELERLLKENEYLRAENAYLKKLDALLQEKKLVAQQKKRK
jgi:transposase